VFGPLDVLNTLARETKLELSILAPTKSPVKTIAPSQNNTIEAFKNTFGESILPTHTFDDAPKDLEVLIIPGGA
jgi:putative intracellular protease/amidase